MAGFCVTIRTSASAVSGTYSNVWISLIGTQCETPSVRVGPGQNHLLPGSACKVSIKPKEDIGAVVLVKLRLEAQPGLPDLDWHCCDVQVRQSSEEPQLEVFPCHKWIRSTDGYIELRNDKMCLKREDTQAILSYHRERELQNKQKLYRWSSFRDGTPHILNFSNLVTLGPNLSYTIERPGVILRYLKPLMEQTTSWSSFQELETFFLFNAGNNLVAKYVQTHWQDDAFFGYQCLNGSNPLYIRRIRKLPSNLAVTSEMLKPFLPVDSSLEQELEKGHIYLLDYEVLDQLPANTINGHRTYLSAPLCLLHYNQNREVKPVAIQAPGPQNPVFFPSDSKPDWLLAKMWVRSSDFQVHQLLSHFLRTHLLAEVCCLAVLRQLPEVHPLYQILMPHLKSSLQINTQARASLLAQNGVFDKSVGCGLEAVPLLLARGTQRLTYRSMCVPDDLEERGLDILPICYYAQDALRVWEALHKFVAGWISLFYSNDLDIQHDCELQNCIKEIFVKGFLGVTDSGIPSSFHTKAETIKFVTMVIFSCSALHSAVNFSQLDFNLWIPNCPAAMLRPPPQTKGSVDEEELLSFLPAVNTSCHVLSVLSLLSQPAVDFVPLCHYSDWFFCSGAASKLVEEVQKELKMIAEDISHRNRQLDVPYTYMSPDAIENSVAI